MRSATTTIMTETAAARALDRHHKSVAVGEAIRYFRQQAGLSQEDLARYAGMSQATVSRVESGARALRPHERAAVTRALGVSLAALAWTERSAA